MSATKNINAEKIQGSLTISSVSASTYYGLPQDIFVSGGTYSAGTATFNNSTGGTFNVTGFYTGANEANYLPLSGGTMSGTLVLNADATTGLQAVTYQQFNNAILGLQIKTTATVATTAALPTNVYLSGVITITATGVLIVDSYTVRLNDYVLVKNEVASQNNGLYKCTTAGAIGVQAVLTRATDMNSSTEFSGAFVPVGNSGTTNANSLWLANPSTPVIVGTTPIPFTQLNGATDLIQGNGISITGNTISNTGVLSIGQGTNIITGGTATNPIINITPSPSVNNFSFSGTATGTILSSTTISANTINTINEIIGVDSFNVVNPEKLLINDNGTGSSGYSNTIVVKSKVNNYAQTNITNQYSGTSASSDIIATSDNGNENVNYIDVGINSSTFSLSGSVGSANDAYVYSTGNNLLLGNAIPGKNVTIFTDGIGGSYIRATFTSGGTAFNGGITSTSVSATTISATTYWNIPDSIGVSVDGQSGVLSTGITQFKVMAYPGRISGWDMTGYVSGNCQFDVWKISSGTTFPTVTNTIVGSAYPQITAGSYSGSTNLTGWTSTSFSTGDIFGFNINSVTGMTKASLSLRILKS